MLLLLLFAFSLYYYFFGESNGMGKISHGMEKKEMEEKLRKQ